MLLKKIEKSSVSDLTFDMSRYFEKVKSKYP